MRHEYKSSKKKRNTYNCKIIGIRKRVRKERRRKIDQTADIKHAKCGTLGNG